MREGQFGLEIEFEKFVRELLQAEGGEILSSESLVGDHVLDILARWQGQLTIIELKAETPQTLARFRGAVAQLTEAAHAIPADDKTSGIGLVLAVPGALARTKSQTAASAGIEVWDGAELRRRALEANVQAPAFLAELESRVADQLEPDHEGADLLLQLEQVIPGKHGWRRYESLCKDLLTYLFCPPLDPPSPISVTNKTLIVETSFSPTTQLKVSGTSCGYIIKLIMSLLKRRTGRPGSARPRFCSWQTT